MTLAPTAGRLDVATEPARTMGRAKPVVLPGIQILRGAAAIAVVLHHTLEESHDLIGRGGAPRWLVLSGASGVDLFFVISGFIMLHTQAAHIGQTGAAGRFLLRRITRIVPLYWLCTAAIVLLHATGLSFNASVVTPVTIAQSLAFVPSETMILGVGWTLRFEMYFYLAFATLLAVPLSGGAWFALPALIAIAVIAGSTFGSPAVGAFLTDPIALEFCLGMVAAAAFARLQPSRGVAASALALGLLGLLAGAAFAPSNGTIGLERDWRFLVWGVPATFVLWSALRPSRIASRVGRALLFLGEASYAIYLTHPFVMIAYARAIKSGVLGGFPPIVLIASVVLASIGLGAGTYRGLDRPVDLWLQRLLKVRRPNRAGVKGTAELAGLEGR